MKLVDGKVERATFTHRVNRFVVECLLEDKRIRAYLPNPGRLWELLHPGKPLLVEKRSSEILTDSTRACLPYTVIAAEREGMPILLHTHLTNRLMEWIIQEKLMPGLDDYEISKREVKKNHSRYDFLLTRGKKQLYLEVKTCTLFHDELAMFPDAVTERGSRHLSGLYELSGKEVGGAVVFVVPWPRANYFMAEYHTDLFFTKTLLKVKDRVLTKAIAVRLHQDLSVERTIKELSIPWNMLEKEAEDRGSYIVILFLEDDKKIEVGRLGNISFKRGYYLYVGSAEKGLTKRIERHRRKRKKMFWHIDYLREAGYVYRGLPIRGSSHLECEIASHLQEVTDEMIPHFGCSDCSCHSHLFWMDRNPIRSPDFVEMLMEYRMGRLERMMRHKENGRL